MTKVYQAFYKNSNGKTTRHNGASLTQVEKEAKLTAQETGTTVCVDVLEIEKPSLKSVIKMLNGEGPLSRIPVSCFRPGVTHLVEDENGALVQRWYVKRVSE